MKLKIEVEKSCRRYVPETERLVRKAASIAKATGRLCKGNGKKCLWGAIYGLLGVPDSRMMNEQNSFTGDGKCPITDGMEHWDNRRRSMAVKLAVEAIAHHGGVRSLRRTLRRCGVLTEYDQGAA